MGVPQVRAEREKVADRCAWWLEAYKETLERFDPLVVACRAAQEKGLEFYAWIDPFDEHYPGHLSHFLTQHPECQWTARDGLQRYNYLRSYAFPEAREDFLGYVREVLAAGPDGLYLCTSCHTQHYPRPVIQDFYGFEAPVAERYLERHGVDIRETLDIDKDAWHGIKGEFVTEFYRSIKDEARKVGAKVCIGCQLGDHMTFRYPFFRGYDHVSARFHADWRTWVNEGIADSLVIGDYQPLWNKGDYWRGSGEPIESADLPAEVAADLFADECKGKAEIYLFSAWMHKPDFPEGLRVRGDVLRRDRSDGMIVHEAMSIEEADAWEEMAAMVG